MPDQQNQPQLMNQPQQPQQWGPRGPMQMGEGEHFFQKKIYLSSFFVVCLKLFLFTNSIGGNVYYLIFPFFSLFYYFCCCYISVMIDFLNV